MTELTTQIIAGSFVLVIGGLSTAIVKVIFTGYKSSLQQLTNIGESCQRIDVTLATMQGRLEQANLWQEMHEKKDDERHEQVTQAQRDIWKTVERSRS